MSLASSLGGGAGAPRDSAGEGQSPSALGAAQAAGAAQRGGTRRSWGGAPTAPPAGRGRSPRSTTACRTFFSAQALREAAGAEGERRA